WSRRVDGKTYIVAATTHPLTFGRWRWSEHVNSPAHRVRISDGSLPPAVPDNAMDRLAEQAQPGWIVHGIDSFPDARSWKPGTRLVQRVELDPRDPPRGLALVLRTEGRWSAIASWGDAGLEAIGADPTLGYWF